MRRAVVGVLLAIALVPASTSAQGRPTPQLGAAAEVEVVRAGTATRVALTVTLPPGFHVQSHLPADSTVIPTVLTITPVQGVTVQRLFYPKASEFRVAGLDAPLLVFDHEFVVGAEVGIGADVPPGDLTIPGRLRYQACDEFVCYVPTSVSVEWALRVVSSGPPGRPTRPELFAHLDTGTTVSAPVESVTAVPPAPPPADADADAGVLAQLDAFAVRGTTGGYLRESSFLTFVDDAARGIADRAPFAGLGPIAIVAAVLLGGLALNLTPCVLPMIPINLAILGAGARAGSARRGWLLGSAYGAAMAAVYGTLGLVVILTASTFGAINASPWFNAGIAVLFVILGLAMFDLVPIDFSRLSSRFRPDGSGSLGMAFAMGGVAALLAGACVAPVVIQVIVFSSGLYAAGTSVALALPFLLGVGMALPWPIAGAGLATLPTPGRWMVTVKHAFGVAILATAAYYGYVAYGIFDSRRVDATAAANSVQEKLADGWTAALSDGLAEAQRDGKPVLIDFWATWCKNCLTMDATTLASPSVTGALTNHVKIKVQAEDPDAEPARSLMARFGAIGLPTYVILYPNSSDAREGDEARQQSIVADVRLAIASGDFGHADAQLARARQSSGVTPEWLEALSWMGRGALAARRWDDATKYARETYDLAVAELRQRPLDREPRLPIALGAAIEVLAQADAAQDARSAAIVFLQRELTRHAGTSIVKRIQKNINLLSLEGTPAPALDVSDAVGGSPVTLAALRGKVVVLFFWAHWCADCKLQAPELERLVKTHGTRDLAILAPTQRFGYIAGGQPAAPAEESNYIHEVRRAYYPILSGQPLILAEANHIHYGVSTTPTLVVVDKAGIIRRYHPGRMSWAELDPLIRSLLAQR
jgi:thiol:disulfide interchange protein